LRGSAAQPRLRTEIAALVEQFGEAEKEKDGLARLAWAASDSPRNNMYLDQVRYGLFGLLENKHLRLGFWCNIDYVVAQIMIRDSP
jgi:hypothetical protein